jgi:hypothetical protein
MIWTTMKVTPAATADRPARRMRFDAVGFISDLLGIGWPPNRDHAGKILARMVRRHHHVW